MKRFFLYLTLFFGLAGAALAQIPQGAAAAASAAARTYTQAEILTMLEGPAVRSGTAALRGGLTFPVFLTGAAIFAGLSWFYNQARSTGTSLDEWYNWQDGAGQPAGAFAPSSCNNAGLTPEGTYQGTNGTQTNNWSWACGTGRYYGSGTCLREGVQWRNGNMGSGSSVDFASLQQIYAQYAQYCALTAVPQPSLADWIRGTYTPKPGQTAVPHPDAVDGINQILPQYLPTLPMPTPGGAPGVQIGPPQPTQDEWEDGCPSGTDWNGSQCIAPTPETCQPGFSRPSPGAACEPDPTPETCQPGYSRPTPGAACQPDPVPCPTGFSRPPSGGACQPDTEPPPTVNYPCPGMAGSGDLVGFVVNFFPNMVALGKCLIVPTRDVASRTAQLSTLAKTKFPFSVASSLSASLTQAPGTGNAPDALPAKIGMFPLPWGGVSPLWIIIKSGFGFLIWFACAWWLVGKLTPQAVI